MVRWVGGRVGGKSGCGVVMEVVEVRRLVVKEAVVEMKKGGGGDE